MTFPFNFFLIAFAGAFLTTLLALPLWRKWCRRVNLVDDPGRRKIHDAPVPLAGGFAVLSGILLPLMAGAIFLKLEMVKISFAPLIVHGINRRALELAVIAFGAIAITVLGWLDDRHELKPLPKFAGQFLVALLVATACNRITLFVPSLAFSYVITILWVLTIINAFNFMDNMNGLCAGLGAIGALLFAIIAAANDEYLVALTGFLMCGALLGFLPWNFPNARAFLGDAARGHGHPAALLHQAASAAARRAVAAAGAGFAAGRPRMGRGPANAQPQTVLDWRHEPSFASTRARRLQPDARRARYLADGRDDRRARRAVKHFVAADSVGSNWLFRPLPGYFFFRVFRVFRG